MYQVIIADDESTIRKGIVSLFPWQQLGFQVAGNFQNGQEAYNFILGHHVDLILSDIRMPIMSGLELSRRLMEENRHIRIVFFSGFQDFSYAKAALHNGVFDYLIKPVKYDELLDCLTRLKVEFDRETASDSTEPERPSSYYEQIVATIQSYLDANYQNATLEQAARLVSLSPNYVSRIMKEHASCSFSDYLLKCRMEQAAHMLRDIHFKQYEVAYRVGYDNPKNFSRAFHQYFKVTPTEYRNQPHDN